ncbi:hypothetical protein BGW36DRAFT_390847 [Talaromyces proteolyticus]|uniref:Uncharacterized protein n=1 Tax=Talaromyces proteolyticus TaxID=1131652 RepID=A0AAD4KH93_9EURO|nr:uncharacterized protein BGW36DRAFT_390847 [Talaromyces proteolyticus]KAH8689424.1 hypothetical protein BGW36DRAFT_390847 [Talaromyces proteolyticus]
MSQTNSISLHAEERVDYDADYVSKFELPAHKGVDVAIYDLHYSFERIRYMNPANNTFYYMWRLNTQYGETFHQDKEDLWLFNIHIANCEHAIFSIGPYQFDMNSNWKFFTQFKQHDMDLNWDKSPGNGPRNRYVAIRAPKMDNPAITVSAPQGEYLAVKWIGLFVKANAAEKHEFVTVRTTCRLNEPYAERHRYKDWWKNGGAWELGVDVVGRSITVFPKQLFGTSGIDRDLYKKFVSGLEDVEKLSQAHIEIAKQNGDSSLKPYMWFMDRATIIAPTADGKINYFTGTTYEESSTSGFSLFEKIFTPFFKIATALLSGNFVGVVEEVFLQLNQAAKDDFKTDVDLSGYITAICNEVKKHKGDDLSDLNRKTIPQLRGQASWSTHDFGAHVSKGRGLGDIPRQISSMFSIRPQWTAILAFLAFLASMVIVMYQGLVGRV